MRINLCFHKYEYLWTQKDYDQLHCTKCGKLKLVKSNKEQTITKAEYVKRKVFEL